MSNVAIVRYGAMKKVGPFTHTIVGLRCGQQCVARTERGLELGEVLCAEPRPAQIAEGGTGRILRIATEEDLAENQHIAEAAPAKFTFCAEEIKRLKLPMKLVDVEHLFGGDKIIFYFVSDGRVDFRQLVKDLAKEYQTRIELRQIGVRDEARLLGDYERCGQPICCRRFIKDLAPVSMRMAKNQKATLDPTKISGRCGRLMCCLRFEDQTYEELKRNLPRKGTRVETPRGAGQVIDGDILTQVVQVETSRGHRFAVPLEEVTFVDRRDRPSRKGGGRQQKGPKQADQQGPLSGKNDAPKAEGTS